MVECHYNMIQYDILLHAVLQKQIQDINHSLCSKKTPHTSAYGVSVVIILEKIDPVIMALYCINSPQPLLHYLNSMEINPVHPCQGARWYILIMCCSVHGISSLESEIRITHWRSEAGNAYLCNANGRHGSNHAFTGNVIKKSKCPIDFVIWYCFAFSFITQFCCYEKYI